MRILHLEIDCCDKCPYLAHDPLVMSFYFNGERMVQQGSYHCCLKRERTLFQDAGVRSDLTDEEIEENGLIFKKEADVNISVPKWCPLPELIESESGNKLRHIDL